MRDMRKIVFLILAIASVLLVTACGASTATTATAPSQPKEKMTNAQIDQLMGDPDKYKGYPIELTGKVFVGAETKDGVSTFQMWADPKNNKGNVVVYTKGSSAGKENDFVKITGIVQGKLEGKNGFGAAITAPAVQANTVEKINPMDILAPTKLKVDVNKTVDQRGYQITLQKVEFADTETRVYLKVTNNTKGKINFWKYEAKAVQGGKQFDQETNYEADYPDIQSDILPGVSSEGIITFKPLAPGAKSAQFFFDGAFDDWSLHFNTAKFDVTW